MPMAARPLSECPARSSLGFLETHHSTMTLTLSIGSRMSDVRLIGRATRSLCETHMSRELSGCVEICVVEAVNNVIEHAYRKEDGHELSVRLDFNENHLKIEVEDSGNAMSPGFLDACWSGPEFNSNDLDSLPEGGMGLPLIHATMDSVDYRHKNGVNILMMKVGYESKKGY